MISFRQYLTEFSFPFSSKRVGDVNTTIVSFLTKKLGKLYKLPDEHFVNSKGSGWGMRFIIGSTGKSIRLNWVSKNDRDANHIKSIDIWNGTTHDPNFNIRIDGSLVKILPQIVNTIQNPETGEQTIINEARVSKYTPDQLVDIAIQFVNKAKTFTKSGFASVVGYQNAGVIDILVDTYPKFFKKEGKKTVFKGGQIDAGVVKQKVHERSTHIVVAPGGTNETYLPSGAEQAIVERVPYTDQLEHLEALTSGLAKGAFNALFVAGRGGIGKTATIERTLAKEGLADGNGYYKITGAASPIGIYATLYNYRNDIVVFDDSDGAMQDVDARGLIKAATDTKKERKLVWNKRNSFIYDPENEEVDEEEDGVDKFPKHFMFKGRVIFISNLPLAKLDPDGAIRTRAFVINIDPTVSEIFSFMETIIDKIELEGTRKLGHDERLEVLNIVKDSKRKEDVSIRKLVRALNLASSGVPNWKKLVDLYC